MVTVPKIYFNQILMEYNHFQHQHQTNFEPLRAQECTHMSDTGLWVSTDKKIWKHLRKAEKGLKSTK